MFFTNVTIMPPGQCSQSLVQCYSPYRAEEKKPKTFEHSRRKRIKLARDFSYRVKTGNFIYLQEQLCAIPRIAEIFMRENNLPLEIEKDKLHTPFGEVEFELRPCPIAHRYTVFIKDAGTYEDITRSLEEKFTNPEERKKIYDTILKYLRSKPTDPLKGLGNQGVYFNAKEDNDLAKFCTILTICDPCFGEGENGGKDIRALLEIAKIQGWKFANFAEPRYNPFCIKGAYELLRDSVQEKTPNYKSPKKIAASRALNDVGEFHSVL